MLRPETSTSSRRSPGARRVVYTCMFGSSEHFNDHHYDADDVEFICFTDDPHLTSSFWTMRLVPLGLLDPARRSKQIKALPHKFLPDHDLSLYIDNTVRLKLAPSHIFNRYLGPSDASLLCFKHAERDCVYDEAEVIIDLAYDDPDLVRRQMAIYRAMNYPERHGLVTSSFLLRRHHDAALRRVMESWHEQVLRHSMRDQLSLNPVMWSQAFSCGVMPEDFADRKLFDWPVIKHGVRVPRDFDDMRYRMINPDVTGDARRHYLEHGAAEGRSYK